RCGLQRRAWDSNPQPLSGHLISSQAPHQFGYPPGPLGRTAHILLGRRSLAILAGERRQTRAKSIRGCYAHIGALLPSDESACRHRVAAIKTPNPALLLLAAFSSQAGALDWAWRKGVAEFGSLARESDAFTFAETAYYEPTMGAPL